MKAPHIQVQRGMTLMVVCFLLVAFLGVAALCIDLGVLYTARTSAQHPGPPGRRWPGLLPSLIRPPQTSRPRLSKPRSQPPAATRFLDKTYPSAPVTLSWTP